MKHLLFPLHIPFAIAVAAMASAGVQDPRAAQAPTAVQVPTTVQQEWRFDVDQPNWKPSPESDPSFPEAIVSRTADALRVTIPDGKRRGSGTLGGGIYVDVPPLSVPFGVLVQARTKDSIPRILLAFNLTTTAGFETFGDDVAPVSDGAVHEYGLVVWPIRHPLRQLGLWIRASEPASVDILSIKFVRQATTARWEYRGFAVDVAEPDASWNRDAFLQGVRQQFDIVASAGLDQRTLDFFRSVPTVINPVAPANQARGFLPARYVPGPMSEAGPLVFAPRVYEPDQPVFLHEYLHAYHDQKLAGGFRNPDILRLFKEAGDGQAFPRDSYMMKTAIEYFAVAGSMYLYGSGGIDPLTRQDLKNRQPALYQWFVKEFGPR